MSVKYLKKRYLIHMLLFAALVPDDISEILIIIIIIINSAFKSPLLDIGLPQVLPQLSILSCLMPPSLMSI